MKIKNYIILVIVLWTANCSVFFFYEAHGTFGDQFGAVNALFSGLAFVGLIFTINQQKTSIDLQREDLRNQLEELRNNREELELSRREMEEQTAEFEKQNRILKIQQFENTFFQMMSLQQQIVNGLELEVRTLNWRAIQSSSPDQTSKTKFKGREVFEQLYVNRAGRMGLKGIIEEDGLTGYVNDEDRSMLDHYFRHLYTILKFIDQSNAITNFDDKYQYATILRATLSRYELVLLYYNGLSDLGRMKLKPLIEKYSMLKNLNEDLLTLSLESLNMSGFTHAKEIKEQLAMSEFSPKDYFFLMTSNDEDEMTKYKTNAFCHGEKENANCLSKHRMFVSFFEQKES